MNKSDSLRALEEKLEYIKSDFDLNCASLHSNFISPDYFHWDDLDDALFVWEPDNDIKIYKDGPAAPSDYTESYVEFGSVKNRLIKHKLYDYIDNGASIVLNKIQNKSRVINDICIRIAKFTNSIVNANAYAAKGGTGTFDMHWDTHDVFAIQLIGRKRWRIFKPTFENPLPHQKSSGFKHLKPSSPEFEVVTGPGDLLYIPRGWWHEALPLENEETFHIAVGVFPVKLIDYLSWIIQNKLSEDSESRNYLNSFDADLLSNSTALFRSLAMEEHHYDEFMDNHVNNARIRTNFRTGMFFGDTKPNRNITQNDIFRSADNTKTVNGVKVVIDDKTRSIIDETLRRGIDDNESHPVMNFLKSLHKVDVIS